MSLAPREFFDQLRRDEGLRLYVYLDSVGKATIGYGRNLVDAGISHDEAEILLRNDLLRTLGALDRDYPWWRDLGAVRSWVVANMAFNLGVAGFGAFQKAITAMQARDREGAARDMLDSKWAGQVGARAHRLADQMRCGEWR